MKYLNPLAFLAKMNGGPVDMRDSAALSLLRKKMMAELELSDDKLLKVGGQVLTRQDLLQFFDQLQNTQEGIYHQQIAQDPALLHFLETGEMKGPIADHVLYKDDAFLLFMAPYYEPLFTVAVLNSLKQQDLATTQHLFSGPLLLDGAHITASYRQVLRYLKTADNELKAVVEELSEGAAYRWKYLAPMANPQLIKQLNILPQEFNKWRSDYGISMINLALAIYTKDFKQGIKVLELAAQLHTSDYVQERIAVRKQELLDYRKNEWRRRPLVDWLGSLTGGIRPKQMTERAAGLLIIGTIVLVVISLNFVKILHGTRRMGPVNKVARGELLFTNSYTGPQMKLLVAQLEYSLSEKSASHLPNDTTPAATKTGDDVYGAGFMKLLEMNQHIPPSKLFMPKSETDNSPAADDSTGFIDPLHRQHLRVYNRLEVPMVVLLQTPDTFYSSFITPHDSTFVPLQTTANRVYFYIGLRWTVAKAPATGSKFYQVKEYFAEPYKNAAAFLREGALSFMLEPTYWRHSNRYIPLEIGTDGDHLFVNLLDNNADGVDLYIGE
jgi:hypothetical protein